MGTFIMNVLIVVVVVWVAFLVGVCSLFVALANLSDKPKGDHNG